MVVAEHDAERECVEHTGDEEDDEHVQGCADSCVLYPKRSDDEFGVGAQRLWKAPGQPAFYPAVGIQNGCVRGESVYAKTSPKPASL